MTVYDTEGHRKNPVCNIVVGAYMKWDNLGTERNKPCDCRIPKAKVSLGEICCKVQIQVNSCSYVKWYQRDGKKSLIRTAKWWEDNMGQTIQASMEEKTTSKERMEVYYDQWYRRTSDSLVKIKSKNKKRDLYKL